MPAADNFSILEYARETGNVGLARSQVWRLDKRPSQSQAEAHWAAEFKRWLAEAEVYEGTHGIGCLLNEAHPARARIRQLLADSVPLIAAQMEVAAEIVRAREQADAPVN
jgi:hypothetical protein